MAGDRTRVPCLMDNSILRDVRKVQAKGVTGKFLQIKAHFGGLYHRVHFPVSLLISFEHFKYFSSHKSSHTSPKHSQSWFPHIQWGNGALSVCVMPSSYDLFLRVCPRTSFSPLAHSCNAVPLKQCRFALFLSRQ